MSDKHSHIPEIPEGVQKLLKESKSIQRMIENNHLNNPSVQKLASQVNATKQFSNSNPLLDKSLRKQIEDLQKLKNPLINARLDKAINLLNLPSSPKFPNDDFEDGFSGNHANDQQYKHTDEQDNKINNRKITKHPESYEKRSYPPARNQNTDNNNETRGKNEDSISLNTNKKAQFDINRHIKSFSDKHSFEKVNGHMEIAQVYYPLSVQDENFKKLIKVVRTLTKSKFIKIFNDNIEGLKNAIWVIVGAGFIITWTFKSLLHLWITIAIAIVLAIIFYIFFKNTD